MKPNRILLFLVIISLISYQGFCQIGEVNKTLTFSDGFQPSGICWDGSNLWVIDYSQDLINILDPTSGEVLHSFSAPDVYPTGLAWDGSGLWIAGHNSGMLKRIATEGTDQNSLSGVKLDLPAMK